MGLSTNKRWSRFILLAVATLGCCPVVWWLAQGAGEQSEFTNWDPLVAYVGDEACAECHDRIYAQFKRSEMGRSWHALTPEEMATDGWEKSTVHDARRDFSYRAFVEDGRYFQEEFRRDETGRKVHSLVRQARYAIGSGSHGKGFVTDANGYLTAMPIGIYTDAGIWDLSPGYKEMNLRFDRPIPHECLACHAGRVSYVQGSQNRYAFLPEQGLGCEQCHGPGERHVRERRRRPVLDGDTDRTIVNPERLDHPRKNDICLQCHLIPDAQFARKGRMMADFRPGMRLADFREDFLIQNSSTEKFGFASHGPRTAQSRCWTEGPTKGHMTCDYCHDPHLPLKEVPRRHYIERCLNCHERADCGGLAAAPSSDDCVECHMPRAKVADIAHVVFTDHWIRKPQVTLPPRTTDSVTPVEHDSPKLVGYWPREDSRTQSQRSWAIAQIRYFDQHPGDRSIGTLRKAAEILRGTSKQDPQDYETWFVLGVAQFHLGDMLTAARNYERAAESVDLEKALAFSGDAYEAVGLFDVAKRMYQQSIRQWPDYLPAYRRLAALHMREDQVENSVQLLGEVLARNPYDATALIQLGMCYYISDQNLSRAVETIGKSLAINPDAIDAHTSLAFMYVREGHRTDAIAAYNQALRINPRRLDLLMEAAELHEKEGNLIQACELFERALHEAPTLPGVRERIRRLRETPE